MFKLVVLSALLATAVSEPGVVLSSLAPTTYAATIAAPVAAPLSTTYLQSSSYFGAPTVYSDIAYPHFIKKRSAPFYSTYVAPSTYLTGAALAAPYASTYVAPAPISYTSSVLPAYAAPAHFIKKRSVPLLAARTSYIAPALPTSYIASTPLASTYSNAILPSAAYYSSYPGYAAALPFIKK